MIDYYQGFDQLRLKRTLTANQRLDVLQEFVGFCFAYLVHVCPSF
jgi:hypothetical protein